MSVSLRGLGSGRRCGADAERGAVAIVVAAFMIVVMGLAAIVVDLGFARDRSRVAQNAADAAALAAALCLSNGQTGCDAVAEHYVDANGWTSQGTNVSVDTTAQTVRVDLPSQQTPGFFARAIGVNSPDVGGGATATWAGGTAVACALCVLGDYDGQVGDITLAGSLAVNGDISFNNAGGTVTVTGPAGSGVFTHGTVTRGSYTVNGSSAAPVHLDQAISDPLASLPLPPPTGAEGVNLATVATSGPGGKNPPACAPGNYIDFSGCSSLQGNGIYIVTGPVGGGAVDIPGTTGANTLIYLTCNDGANRPRGCATGEKGAYLGGTSDATVNGRSSGAYAGYAVIYDRNNSPQKGDVKVAGKSSLTINGNLYGASAAVDFRGNGGMTISGFAVVGHVTLSGNGSAKNHVDVKAQGGLQNVTTRIPPHLVP